MTVHKVDRRVPAAHTAQAVHEAALVIVLKVDPAKQLVQALLTDTVHAVDA